MTRAMTMVCACGQTFIATSHLELRCPECRHERIVAGVRVIEWMGGPFPIGRMLVQHVPGLTYSPESVRAFIAAHGIKALGYTKGIFDRDYVEVLGFDRASELKVRLTQRAGGWLEDPDDWHATHANAAPVLRREGGWWVGTGLAWVDGVEEE